jgi:CheY-like chemotaxis protein
MLMNAGSFKCPLNVLLVDDDPNHALLVRFGFQKLGLGNSLHVVDSGESAIQYLSGQARFHDRKLFPLPNMILTDLKMPAIDGFEFLIWLRAHPQWAEVPTVVMSSSDESNDVRKAYALGANSFVVKPAELGELTRLIEVILKYWSCCECLPRNGDR